MNVKANYEKGNRLEIIKALHVNGCIPYRCLSLFPGEKRLAQRKALQMNEEGLLNIIKTPYGKCIYLNQTEENIKDYQAYLSDSYLLAYEEIKREIGKSKYKNYKNSRQERLQKNAEVSLFMHLSKIPTYPDEILSEWIPGRSMPNGVTIYLDRIKIKNEEEYVTQVQNEKSGEKKVIGSRLSGLMISPGGNYAVYNLTNHLIEWERAGEVKMAGYLERYLERMERKEDDYYIVEKEEGKNTDVECILLANHMELFYRVLINENRQKYKSRKRRPLINIDYAYRVMYGLPISKEGMMMINIMKEKDWKKQMKHLLLKECQNNVSDYTVECDGYHEKDGYVLMYCDCDIAKLKLFLKRGMLKREDEKFTILCFTFQVPLLQQFDLTGITVKAMELEDYAKMIEKKG